MDGCFCCLYAHGVGVCGLCSSQDIGQLLQLTSVQRAHSRVPMPLFLSQLLVYGLSSRSKLVAASW